ncbi:hypothetical protein FRC05_003859 [Tulasnella sp. 425]|nr:hypothetical protein FRC05_003859 [Tulasnella sp. 425]
MQYLLVSTSSDLNSRVCDTRNGSCIKELLTPEDKVWMRTFSPRGRYFAAGTANGRVLIFSSSTGTLLFEWDLQSGKAPDMDWQSAGDQLAVGLKSGGVAVLDMKKVGFSDHGAP